MTPQEQYPKFYKDPHFWIGAIEVTPIGKSAYMGVNWYQSGHKEKFDDGACYLLNRHVTSHQLLAWMPLFKPQEGEAFIKDLTDAVSAAMGENLILANNESSIIRFTFGFWYISIFVKNLAICNVRIGDNNLSVFDTAAYVDTLRKKGYYL